MKVVWVFDDVTRDTSSSLSSLSSASSSSIAVFIYSIIVWVGLDLPLIYAKGREYYTSYLLRALILLKTFALYKPFTYLFTYLLTYLPPKGKIELRQLTCVFRRTSAAPLANFLHLFGPSSRILVASYRSVIFWTTHSACEMTNTWRRVSSLAYLSDTPSRRRGTAATLSSVTSSAPRAQTTNTTRSDDCGRRWL